MSFNPFKVKNKLKGYMYSNFQLIDNHLQCIHGEVLGISKHVHISVNVMALPVCN